MRPTSIVLFASLCLLTSGQAWSASPPSSLKATTETAWRAAIKAGASKEACSTAIGMKAAKAVVRYCLFMSSATHPPCDTENACNVITDHVDFQATLAPGEVLPGREHPARV